jgi:calcium-dependent protein kinase
MNKLKKQAALVIAAHLPPDQIQGLKELFDSMDRTGKGTITLAELKAALERRGSRLPAGELEELMALAVGAVCCLAARAALG